MMNNINICNEQKTDGEVNVIEVDKTYMIKLIVSRIKLFTSKKH